VWPQCLYAQGKCEANICFRLIQPWAETTDTLSFLVSPHRSNEFSDNAPSGSQRSYHYQPRTGLCPPAHRWVVTPNSDQPTVGKWTGTVLPWKGRAHLLSPSSSRNVLRSQITMPARKHIRAAEVSGMNWETLWGTMVWNEMNALSGIESTTLSGLVMIWLLTHRRLTASAVSPTVGWRAPPFQGWCKREMSHRKPKKWKPLYSLCSL